MNGIINYIKNNIVTIVEALNAVIDAAEILVNGVARLFLPTATVQKIHDGLKVADGWLEKIKGWLVKTAG